MLLQVGQQGVQPARGQHPIASQNIQIALARILRQITDLAGIDHGPGIGLTLPRQDPHSGGLAGTVAAHQSDAVTGLDSQCRSFCEQQGARPGADLKVRSGDHWRRISSAARGAVGYLSSVKTGGRCCARAATASSKLAVSRRT